MAKEQNLSLNPAKISGACGRLMCCLTYECGEYQAAMRMAPPVGAQFRLEGAIWTVTARDIGNHRIFLQDAEDRIVPVDLEQLRQEAQLLSEPDAEETGPRSGAGGK
jgi:hypothetical protein